MALSTVPFGSLATKPAKKGTNEITTFEDARKKVSDELIKHQMKYWKQGITKAEDFEEHDEYKIEVKRRAKDGKEGKTEIVQFKSRLWYFQDTKGNWHLTVKYGNSPINAFANSESWNVGKWEDLGKAFEHLGKAIEAGELDKEIKTAWDAAKKAAADRRKNTKTKKRQAA